MLCQGSRPQQEWKRCPDCGAPIPAWSNRHRSRTCPGYTALWAGDVRRKTFAAFAGYDELAALVAIEDPKVALGSVTAPGVDGGLIWDESVCAHLGEHRHSGKIGCRVQAAAAAHFNRLAPSWWTELHRRAMIGARRRCGFTPRLVDRIWEKQHRGVLHVHPVLGYSSAAERVAADAYLRELHRLSRRFGFGGASPRWKVLPAMAAAAYLSSYFVKGKRGKLTLEESVTSPDMPRSIVYVWPRLSQHSGVTMRSLRLKRFLWRHYSSFDFLKQHFTFSDLHRAARAGLSEGQIIEAMLQAHEHN